MNTLNVKKRYCVNFVIVRRWNRDQNSINRPALVCVGSLLCVPPSWCYEWPGPSLLICGCPSFKCRQMYHAPTDCPTIRKWLTKCADDSETANYISAHTKDVSRAHLPTAHSLLFCRTLSHSSSPCFPSPGWDIVFRCCNDLFWRCASLPLCSSVPSAISALRRTAVATTWSVFSHYEGL